MFYRHKPLFSFAQKKSIGKYSKIQVAQKLVQICIIEEKEIRNSKSFTIIHVRIII